MWYNVIVKIKKNKRTGNNDATKKMTANLLGNFLILKNKQQKQDEANKKQIKTIQKQYQKHNKNNTKQ